jgi:hypothetical protein
MRYGVFTVVKIHTVIFSVMGVVVWWAITSVLEEYTTSIYKAEVFNPED